MIIVIRGTPLRLFDYWKNPVTGRLGRSSQNDSFITVINSQERSALASESYRCGIGTKAVDRLQADTPPRPFKSP